MRKIGLLSDTHGYFHPEIPRIFKDCDEIWHAGDFGSEEVAAQLREAKPLRGVYGNIDAQDIRLQYPEFLRFQCKGVDVLMTHIGGYPGKYPSHILDIFRVKPPDLFICGHSHILKVMSDKRFKLLHINPGAAGLSGFHKVITMLRFSITGPEIKDLEVVEFEKPRS